MRAVDEKLIINELGPNVFAGYTRKILCIFTDFQVPERLQRGPEFSHNYLIDYLRDYTIGFIIITP